MRKYIWQNDGRLKTGRISLIFFICLLLGLGLLFNLQKPVDKAIVVVRHIFTATSKSEPVVKPDKVKPPVKKVENKSVPEIKPKKSKPLTQPKSVKVVNKKNVQPPVSVTKAVTKKSSLLIEKAPAKETAVAQKTAQKDVFAAVVKELNKQTVVASSSSSSSEPKLSTPATDILTEELVVDPQPMLRPEIPAGKAAVTLMTKDQRKLLLQKYTAPKPEKATLKQVKFAVMKPLKANKSDTDTIIKSKEGKSDFKALSASSVKKPEVVSSGVTPGITVARKEYKILHKAWYAAGRSEKDNDHVIPLQIENLKAAYDLLQMKAVVIRPDESCIDLADGSRIPAASLDRFSATVIRVDDPWEKWSAQLKAAGLRPGQPFKVRYYIYDFVRHSIYARVNQAYQWSLAKGLIQAQTKPDEVDVLGRTFVIKRSGGGAFGVFVPLSLKTSDGHRVTIDPLCFRNSPDIKALQVAGLI